VAGCLKAPQLEAEVDDGLRLLPPREARGYGRPYPNPWDRQSRHGSAERRPSSDLKGLGRRRRPRGRARAASCGSRSLCGLLLRRRGLRRVRDEDDIERDRLALSRLEGAAYWEEARGLGLEHVLPRLGVAVPACPDVREWIAVEPHDGRNDVECYADDRDLGASAGKRNPEGVALCGRAASVSGDGVVEQAGRASKAPAARLDAPE